jgi:hypothetical protein
MTWEWKAGDSICPRSAHFEYYGDVPPKIPTIIPGQAAPGESLWLHNGSIMSLKSNGDAVDLYYARPSRFMSETGAINGTPYFKGHKEGQTYQGKAYVYTRYCKGRQFGFEVTGVENAEHTSIVLKGKPPHVNIDICKTGFFDRNFRTYEFNAYNPAAYARR